MNNASTDSTANTSTKTVAIVGASNNPDRYANKAQHLLMDKGYPVIAINTNESNILGAVTVAEISQIAIPVDTVTLYISPPRQAKIIPQILKLKPRRVIFNPGTENPDAYAALQQAGISYEEACTLVLLKTGQF